MSPLNNLCRLVSVSSALAVISSSLLVPSLFLTEPSLVLPGSVAF